MGLTKSNSLNKHGAKRTFFFCDLKHTLLNLTNAAFAGREFCRAVLGRAQVPLDSPLSQIYSVNSG
jgi:hypothetical protein